MGAGSSASFPFSASTINIYSSLPEELTKEQCKQIVGEISTDLLWSRYMNNDGAETSSSCLIKRERLLNLSQIGIQNKRKEKHFKNIMPNITFLNFKSLKANGEFPRYHVKNSGLKNLDQMDKAKAFIVFISHTWQRSILSPEDNKDWRPHPDTIDHAHYQLCIEGIELIRRNHVRNIEDCFVWVDYSCLNQDINPVNEIEELDVIMSACDCVFTPIIASPDEFEPQPVTDIMPEMSSGITTAESYRANAWRGEYLRRSWTRLELVSF